MKETIHQPLAPRRLFITRLARGIFVGIALIVISLFLGMAGYAYFEKMSWTDAYVNAAMILSGMGPVTELKTESGKLFAGTYALFSGIFFLFIMAVIFAPLFHRFLHKLHIEERLENTKKEGS